MNNICTFGDCTSLIVHPPPSNPDTSDFAKIVLFLAIK